MSDQDDVLARMSRALGEENSGDSERNAATRARILASLGGGHAPSRRRPWIPVLLLLGVGTSAWASQSEDVRSWLSEAANDRASSENAHPERTPTERARAARGEKRPMRAPTPEVSLAEKHLPQEVSSAGSRAQTGSAAASATEAPELGELREDRAHAGEPHSTHSARRNPSSPPPRPIARGVISSPNQNGEKASDPGLATYQAAHRAQFSEGDCRAAIDGYRSYLTAHPAGTFEPEARYNSALCSIHLGDHATARVALRPFAEGAYGAYRRERALQLLEAIDP